MDNNNPAPTPTQPQVQPAVPPAAAPIPEPAVSQPVPSPVGGGEKKMVLWIVVGLVVILVVVGGLYFLLNSQNKLKETQAPPAPVSDSETTDSLEKEASSIDVTDADTQFTQVDSDLGSL